MSRRLVLIGGSILGVLVVAVVAALVVAFVRSGEVLAGVAVEDVDLGGLGPDDARQKLQALTDSRAAEQVVFTHGEEQFTIEPSEVGAAVDVDALVDEAMATGREGSFLEDQVTALRGIEAELKLEFELDQEALQGRIDADRVRSRHRAVRGCRQRGPGNPRGAAPRPDPGRDDPPGGGWRAGHGRTGRTGRRTPWSCQSMSPNPTRTSPTSTLLPKLPPAPSEDDLGPDLRRRTAGAGPARGGGPAVQRSVGERRSAELQLVVTESAVEEVVLALADPLVRDAAQCVL